MSERLQAYVPAPAVAGYRTERLMDYTGVWNEIIRELEKTISAVSFDVFIRPLIPVGMRDNKLVLFSETAATKAVIGKNYAVYIRQAIVKCGHDFGFLVIDATEKDEYYKPAEAESPDVSQSQPFESGLNPKYTFDTFVVGKNNMFVQAAARAVAESPGAAYNPLFIYGGVGLGKTHIMHAIGNYITARNSGLRVIYVTSENFTNEMIAAIAQGNAGTSALRSRYRTADVLMIDDIQFLINKPQTQEEFFNTFNDLHSAGKQIIISSDRHPKEINPLEERLRSRFGWGLLADISPPDLETRIAILRRKAKEHGRNIADEVIQYIAEQNDSNIRVLEENLNRVYFHATLFNQELSVATATVALRDSNIDSNEAVNMDTIIDVVCSYYRVSREDLTGKRKTKEIVFPRQMCVFLICEILGVPLQRIGQIMGDRDHTTMMYARDKIAEDLKRNDNIKRAVTDIRNRIHKK